jgi:hypothetical protein
VLIYEYKADGFCLIICKDIGFFVRTPTPPMTAVNWAELVRGCARTWTEIEARKKGGYSGGQN